jgi:hypothetical protein
MGRDLELRRERFYCLTSNNMLATRALQYDILQILRRSSGGLQDLAFEIWHHRYVYSGSRLIMRGHSETGSVEPWS